MPEIMRGAGKHHETNKKGGTNDANELLDSEDFDLSALHMDQLQELHLEAIKRYGDAREFLLSIERNCTPGIRRRRQVAMDNLERAETNLSWVQDDLYRPVVELDKANLVLPGAVVYCSMAVCHRCEKDRYYFEQR